MPSVPWIFPIPTKNSSISLLGLMVCENCAPVSLVIRIFRMRQVFTIESLAEFGVKTTFYNMKKYGSYFWSGRPDLNRGPPAPKAGALPGCATPRHEVLY